MNLGLAGGLVVFMLTVGALSAGPPAAVGEFTVASLSFTAMVATFCGVTSWTAVLLYNRMTRPATRAAGAFGAFLIWAFGSLVIGGTTRQGLQFLLVQTAFLGALLVAATARRVVGSSLDVVVGKSLRVTASVLIASAVLGTADPGLKLGVRPSALISLICLSWFLAEYRLANRRALWWSLATVLGIALSLSRSALFAAFVLVVATAFFASKEQRARNAVLCLIIVAVGHWGVTSWGPLRERFTEGDVSLSVGGVAINAEGRTEVWGILWTESQGELLTGRGPGAASARSLAFDAAFDHPHNDYLRVLYDFGLVGIGLLAWFGLRSARLLRRARHGNRESVPPLAALNAGLAMLIVLATDNAMDYAFVMIPLGTLFGLGLGIVTRPDPIHAPASERDL